MRLWKKKRGRMLEGAPRKTRLPRPPLDPAERQRRAAFIFLGVTALLAVGAASVTAWVEYTRLDRGLLAQRDSLRRRGDWVSMEQLPPHLPAAFAVVVDTTPYTRRSAAEPVSGPMLSRDLVRQVHRLGESPTGSARELFLAPLLERALGRRRLLELYLNRIRLGESGDWGVYGVLHAARDYFGKDVRRLTLGESATLAGILLEPRLQAPETAPGAVGARRNEVLRRMVTAGTIDPAAARAAAAEPLAFQPGADYAPMTRPPDWKSEPAVIRLPPELRVDSAAAARTQP